MTQIRHWSSAGAQSCPLRCRLTIEWEVYFLFLAKRMEFEHLFPQNHGKARSQLLMSAFLSLCPDFLGSKLWHTQCSKYHRLLDLCPCILDFCSFSALSLRNGYSSSKVQVLFSPQESVFNSPKQNSFPPEFLHPSGISHYSIMFRVCFLFISHSDTSFLSFLLTKIPLS